MPTLSQLLANVPQQQAQPQSSGGDLMSTLADVGGAGLGAVASVGNFLDLPGSSVRDILAGENPLDQWLSPLSDKNRTTGRQLLEQYGMRKNRETGLMGWLTDPGEGLRDLAGFAAEIALDPFGPVTKAAAGAKALAPVISFAGRAHPAVKAVGRGAKYIFDTIPEKMTRPIVDTLSSTGRTLRSLFDKGAEGITEESVMPFAEQARAAADQWRGRAGVQLSELVTTSNSNGFNLVADDTLDLKDPANLMKDNSMYRVRAREDQIRRAIEGVYNPDDATLRPGDLATIGQSDQIRQVEFINRTPTGTQVKFADDDTLYNDWDVQPHYLSAREQIPQPVLDTIERIKTDFNAVRGRLKDLGYDPGELIDVVDFAHRRKSNELRQAEQIGGLNIPNWLRKNNRSLTDSLAVPGGREMVYRAFRGGTTDVNQLYNDPAFQSIVEHIDSQAAPIDIDGLTTSILPDMVGVKHIADMASTLDMAPEELWQELVRTRPVNKTGTVAYTTQPGTYDVVSGTQAVGQFGVRMIDDIAEVSPTYLQPDQFDDAMQYVEHDLATKGASRVDVKVTPDIADVLKKRGYQGSQIVEDGTEVWSKPLYQAGKMVVDHPLMLSKAEFKDSLQKWYDWQVTQVKDGNAKGFQPGRGWWKSWTDLRPGPNGEERIINFDAEGFQPIDLNTLDAMRPVLPNVEDYDIARAALESGKEVLIGKRVLKRGKPAEFVMITPTIKAQVEGRFKKVMERLDETMSSDPLTAKEAIYDHLHRAIERNYGDRVDKWMPALGERGMVTSVAADGTTHAASVNQWHKIYNDTLERGEGFTAPMRALLRLDDTSLKAMLFTDDQIAELTRLRGDIVPDASIELVDRHRALALDMGDKVERRYVPMFSRSAGADQFDYITRNGAAVEVLTATKNYLAGAVKSAIRDKGDGIGKLTADLDVVYDPASKRGVTMAEAIQQGFFPEKLNKEVFTENIRQDLIADGVFKESDDPKEILRQMNTIKSVRLNANTWKELKTFNEGFTGEMPELNAILRGFGSLATLTKAFQLSWSPATAIRDGGSSMANAFLMGGMNPVTALGRWGKKAWSFIRGASIDPGEGIQEIENYLAVRGLQSNPKTRGEAFQNMWNSYTMSGSLHPNVVTADAARMAESELTSDMVGNQAKMQEFVGGLKRTVLRPWKIFDPRVQGVWTRDELGRVVQRSKSENPLVDVNNNLRGMIDNFVRSMYVMDRASKTGSLQDAFAAADKFLLNADPSKFTRFENKYMKTLIPFYSFMRQSLPLFMSEMIANPGGKLGMTIRATRLGQGGSDGYVPYQYLDTAAIPLGQTDDGTLKYMTSFGLMHEDAVKYAGNLLQGDLRALQQQVTSSASPLIKWWIENSTNTSLFSQGPMGGRRLDDLDPSIGRVLSNVGLQDVDASDRARPFLDSPTLESLAAAGPASRIFSIAKVATDQRADAMTKVLRLLTGVRTEYVTQEMVTRDLRDRLNAIQIEAGARPLTTVSGTEKLQEHLTAQGDMAKVAVLQRIEEALAVQRKLVRDREKMKKDAVVDMLQQAR